MYKSIQLEYLNKSADVEEGIKGAPSSQSADSGDITSVLNDIYAKNDEILLEIQEIKDIVIENIDMAKDFVSVGFGVLIGVVVGYIILKFLGDK